MIRFKIEQPNLCPIFNSKPMKKIFLVSCFILASVAMTSCTSDDVETTPKTSTQQVIADGDGQSGQIPVTPPKP